LFTINADKEYAFASKNKRQVFIRICCLAIGGTTFIVTMFVCKQTHAKIYAKISFFSPIDHWTTELGERCVRIILFVSFIADGSGDWIGLGSTDRVAASYISRWVS